MRSQYLCALAALLLAVLGAIVYFFFEENLYKESLALMALARDFVWRALIWTADGIARVTAKQAVLFAALPLLPLSLRHWMRAAMRRISIVASKRCKRVVAGWSGLEVRTRVWVCIVMTAAIYGLSLMWDYAIVLVNFVPFQMDAASSGLAWVKNNFDVVAMRAVTTKSIDHIMPAMLTRMPKRLHSKWAPAICKKRRLTRRYLVSLRKSREHGLALA